MDEHQDDTHEQLLDERGEGPNDKMVSIRAMYDTHSMDSDERSLLEVHEEQIRQPTTETMVDRLCDEHEGKILVNGEAVDEGEDDTFEDEEVYENARTTSKLNLQDEDDLDFVFLPLPTVYLPLETRQEVQRLAYLEIQLTLITKLVSERDVIDKTVETDELLYDGP